MGYAEIYQKMMAEKKPQVEAAFKKAKETAMSHQMHHTTGEDGSFYPLADMLTPKRGRDGSAPGFGFN